MILLQLHHPLYLQTLLLRKQSTATALSKNFLHQESRYQVIGIETQYKTKNEAMFSSGEEAAAIAVGQRRDRSYSDAHALLHSVSTNTEDQHHHHAPNITVDSNKAVAEEHMIYKAASPLLVTKMNASKKSHHHHGNNRPRSKSLDLHRHTSTPSKKKYPHHPPGSGAGHHHHHHGMMSAGRCSPGSSPKLKGKMWIRPEAAPSPASIKVPPFFPMFGTVYVAPTPSHRCTKEEHASRQCSKDGSKDNEKESKQDSSTKDQLKDGSSSTTTTRQVTDESSPSPTSLNNEMMMTDMYSTATGDDLYQQSKASYEYERQYLQQHHPQEGHNNNNHGPTRIIFGESGKPIQPRSAFEQYSNPSTSPVL